MGGGVSADELAAALEDARQENARLRATLETLAAPKLLARIATAAEGIEAHLDALAYRRATSRPKAFSSAIDEARPGAGA